MFLPGIYFVRFIKGIGSVRVVIFSAVMFCPGRCLVRRLTSSEKIEKLYELSLILKSHACLIVTQNVIERFSVTIDCVRFLIRGFPLYTYSMP